eukprot:2348796-Rhodomonas_salina.1
MEWMESKEEEDERTIINLLEKEEIVEDDGSWENEDETLNLLPQRDTQPQASVRGKGNQSGSARSKKSGAKEGRW